MFRVILLLILPLSIIPRPTAAQLPNQTLALEGVRVVVPVVMARVESPVHSRVNVDSVAESLQTEFGLALRQEGLHVLEAPPEADQPVAFLTIAEDCRAGFGIKRGEANVLLCFGAFKLLEIANLRGKNLGVVSYEFSNLWNTTEEEFLGSLKTAVEEMIKKFFNDYLTANPKKGG